MNQLSTLLPNRHHWFPGSGGEPNELQTPAFRAKFRRGGSLAGITFPGKSLGTSVLWLSLTVAFIVSAFGGPLRSAAQPPITALAMAPGDNLLVAGSQLGMQVDSWPSLRRKELVKIGIPQIHDLAFSPNGEQLLVVGGAASEYGEWNLYSWPQLEVIANQVLHDDVIHSAAWLSDQQFVTAAADKALIQWQLSGDQDIQTQVIQGHSRRVLCVAAIRQSNLVVSAGIDQVLRVWDAANGNIRDQPLRNLDNHTGPVYDLAVRPGNSPLPYLASTSSDKTVRLWQPTIGRLVRFARMPVEPCSIAWSHDGAQLAVGCSDGKLRVLNPNRVEIEQTLDAIDGWAFEVAAADDGSFAVAGEGGSIVRVVPAKPQG